MKKLVKGFTLAEVLITLSIIGVIASMTLPTLMVNVQKQQAGPALAKAINSLESANAQALHDMGCRDLTCGATGSFTSSDGNPDYSSKNASQAYFDILRPYLSYTSTEYGNVTKDGIVFSTSSQESHDQLYDITGKQGTSRRDVHGRAYRITTDINGSKGPNEEGVDIFNLYVDLKGTVFAEGSRALYDLSHGEYASWEQNCYTKKTKPKDPSTCAGSIVDNGFKVIY